MKQYFQEYEFASPDEQGSGLLMDANFLYKLNYARHLAETAFVITSGYRTIAHNKAVGGSKTSSHLSGLAVDISARNSLERLRIIQGLIDAGFTRIGIGNNFCHVDLDTSKSDALWLY
jgi:uncharacterized protein YcbK (DUF882 family)